MMIKKIMPLSLKIHNSSRRHLMNDSSETLLSPLSDSSVLTRLMMLLGLKRSPTSSSMLFKMEYKTSGVIGSRTYHPVTLRQKLIQDHRLLYKSKPSRASQSLTKWSLETPLSVLMHILREITTCALTRALIPRLPVREKTMTSYVSKKEESKLQHNRISKKRKRKRRGGRFRMRST